MKAFQFPLQSVLQYRNQQRKQAESRQQQARKMRAILSTHHDVEDLLRIGAYAQGSNPRVEKALELLPDVESFLQQQVNEQFTFEQTRQNQAKIAERWPF